MPIFFDDFELDVDRYLLLRGGRAVRLRPKAFDLLAYLVTHRTRVVRRAELVDAVWGHTSVGPGSLSGLVNELRSALGEGAGVESSIRTVHARGYQFVARVAPSPPAPERSPDGPTPANSGVSPPMAARRRAMIRRALLDVLRRFGIAETDPATQLLEPLCDAVDARAPMRPMRTVRRDSVRRATGQGSAGT